MDPITFIIIVKALGLGKGFLPTTKVEQFYDEAFGAALQQEIMGTLYSLIQLHTALALLQAAANQPTPPNGLAPGKPPEEGHIVLAYDTEDIGSIEDQAVGTVTPSQIQNHFAAVVSAMENVGIGKGRALVSNLLQKVEDPDAFPPAGVSAPSMPVLEIYFRKLQVLGLPSQNFDPDVCLKQCRDSVTVSNPFHQASLRYATMALSLVKLLWGADVKSSLAKVATWLGELPGGPATTEAWLNQNLQPNGLVNLINTAYGQNGSAETQMALSRLSQLLEINQTTFLHLYTRFGQDQEKLGGVIAQLKAQVPPAQRQAWDDLLAVTCGYITWKIVQQARLVTGLTRLISGG